MKNHKWKVLLVDDEPNNLRLMRHILSEYYKLSFATNGIDAIDAAKKVMPDIILMDIMMPEMDGYEACKRLKADKNTAQIPVIFITAMNATEDERLGFEVGGVDYITKPISPTILLARVSIHIALYNQQIACEKKVIERTAKLEEIQRAALFMLGEAGDYNDTDTGVHIWRMADYSSAIGRCLGWNVDKSRILELAASMHDIGKIGIPDSILKKKGKLSDDEWKIMKTHPEIGYNILSKSNTLLFIMASDVALFHHEKWDGTGYPRGLKEKHIPEAARIVAVADVFDALTMERPYKDAWSVEKAVEEIKKGAGSHFDPEIVQCFLNREQEIRNIKTMWDNEEEKGVRPFDIVKSRFD
ncbi:MAG: HD domain-containing phosphohydrolase [Desulfamplus sp.]